MHEDDVRETLDKIQQGDKIIYNQQLGCEWTPPEDPFQQNYTKDQTKDGIEEKILAKNDNLTLIEKLLEKEGDMFKKNLFNLMSVLETEAKWLLDEDSQNESNSNKR